MYEALELVLAARPDVVVIQSTQGDLDGTYVRLRQVFADLMSLLGGGVLHARDGRPYAFPEACD